VLLLAEKKLTPSVILNMKADIIDAGGNEVLWIGHLRADGLVDAVEAAARGNQGAVGALFPHMEKGDVILHNHPSGNLVPSNPDLNIASQLGNNGIGFYIVNNELSEVYVVSEPVLLKVTENLDEEELAHLISPGGTFSQKIPHYQHRQAQVDLLKAVTRAFNQQEILIAEAGTGVGKSFAYLIPALHWSSRNQQRVVISTGTINLQQQLYEKDIPLVNKYLGLDVKTVLVKGRGNYLCPVRPQEELKEVDQEDEEYSELQEIKDWAEVTANGSLSDLSFLPSSDLWSRICSEADTCTGLKCFQRDSCFVTRARKEASSAGLLVVNHHLLFADLALRLDGFGYEQTAVLPPFTRLVFDEAHGMERAATSYFSQRFTPYALNRSLRRLYRNRKGRMLGIFPHYDGFAGQMVDLSKIPGLMGAASHHLEELRKYGIDELGGAGSLRYKLGMESRLDSPFFRSLGELRKVLIDIQVTGKRLLESLDEEERELPSAYELSSVMNRLDASLSVLGEFRQFAEREEEVFFIEATGSRGKRSISLSIAPLIISEKMQKGVFDPMETVILTSATLAIGDSFRYFRRRSGVPKEEGFVQEALFPSPFDYKNRVLLGVPNNGPLPSDEGFEAWATKQIEELTAASGGGALVLFTSYESMNRSYSALESHFASLGIQPLRQGSDDRARLLTRFREDTHSVLFATDSFWEGVDSPGETLRLVILVKLPFRVPSEPLVQARMELLEKRGYNSFSAYSLPEAVMRLKQGFGRLMRRHEDYGAVVVLDSRIVKKSYGRTFLQSLPPARFLTDKDIGVISAVEVFFDQQVSRRGLIPRNEEV
jgi:ATP-dependent DNA helicase DinG